MTYLKHSKFIRLVVLPLTLNAFLPACYKWTEVETPVNVSDRLPSPAHVTLKDGRRLKLEGATVEGDFIVGMVRGSNRSGQIADRVRIPIDEVLKVERRERNKFTTTLLVVSAVYVTLALIVTGVCASDPDGCSLFALE